MTVSTTSTKVQYNGDGSTTAFSVPFKYLSKDDVKVILTDADGDDTEWTRGTQYTLSAAGVDAGGTLTVSTSPTNYTPQAGERLTILLDAEATQNVDLPLGGPFPSTSVETALDRLTLLVQQREEENARSLRFPESDPTTIDGTIPSSANRANMVLGFNSDGEPTVYSTNVETVTASSTNYDNAASGLAAINVQDAIDELADEKFDKTGGSVSGDVSVTGAVSATTSISAASLAGDWIATQAEAEAGTNNDQVMTPLRTKQAIAALMDTASSFAANGYVTLSNGLVLQWGSFSAASNATGSITFPTAFPTACFTAQIVQQRGSGNGNVRRIESVSTTGFSYHYDNLGPGAPTVTNWWFALGH